MQNAFGCFKKSSIRENKKQVLLPGCLRARCKETIMHLWCKNPLNAG
jgi:hypothetical protein